jgi:hypothetical protein
MSDDRLEGFKKDLKELLEKYTAAIGFSTGDGSDTFGLFDDRIVVFFDGNFDKEYELASGWAVYPSDMK